MNPFLPNTRLLKKVVHLIGAQVKEGQDHFDGVDQGPDAIRNAGILRAIEDLGWLVKDHGNFNTKMLKKSYGPGYAKDIVNVRLLGDIMSMIHKEVRAAAQDKGFVLTLGGDHSIASGTISGLKTVYPNLKVLWIDAHSDCVIPELANSKYRNYHGMPVSHLMGWINKDATPNFEWMPRPSLKPSDICYIGIRDMDYDEKSIVENFKMKAFTPDHIMRYGIGEVVEKALEYLDYKNNPIHISFDIDGMDPFDAPGTGTRCREGINYREGLYIMKRVCATGSLVSMDMVEINPLLDEKNDRISYFGDNSHIKGTKTVLLGCELILAALGRKPMPFIEGA